MIIKSALSGDNHTNTPGRSEEARRVHEAMLEDWTRRDVDFIGFAGDWNEVPPNERDQAWSRGFLGRCAMRAPVILIPGNHDPELSLSEFHVQSEFKYPITVVTQPDVITVETKAGLLAVACVPFVWKAHLLARLGPVSVEEADQMTQALLGDIFRGLGVKVRALNLPTVALIHGKWRGSRLSDEQPNRPLGMEIPIEDIGMIGAHVTCVAHIHLHQTTVWNERPIATPSSCYYVDYGEAAHKKGYLWAEIEETRDVAPFGAGDTLTEREGEPYFVGRMEHIPTPVTPMILLVADFANGAFEKWRTGQKEDHPIALEDLSPDGVDFRFRYHYPKAEEKTAKSAAGELKKQLESQGAVNVKLDPVPIPAQTTRSLEIVKARTLTEKAKLLWAARGLNLSPDEETICAEMIERLQTQFGFGQRLTLDAGIHVKNTRMKGWRCFPEEVSFDFDAIEGEVIAVGGPNGVGKSLFWELAFPGAIFRELPTHGNIGDHALARDTFVQTNFEYNGGEFTVSQIIDGKSGSSSLTSGGRAVVGTETALRTDYDKWAEKNLPPFTLVKSTTFMPQESKGILGMGTKDRKALILRAKGAERYEVLAEEASKQSAAADKEALRLRGQMEGLEAEDVGPLQASLATIEGESNAAKEKLSAAEADLASARSRVTEAEQRRSEYDALVRNRDDLSGRATALGTTRGDTMTRLAVCQELTGQRVQIEDAVAQIEAIQAEINSKPTHDLDLRLTKESGDADRLRGERAALQRRTTETEAHLEVLNQRLNTKQVLATEARALMADANAIRAGTEELAEHQASRAAKLEEQGCQRTKEATLKGNLGEVRARYTGNAQRVSELQRRIESAQSVFGLHGYLKSQAVDALESVRTLEAEIARVETERARYWTEIEALRELIATAKDVRIKNFQDPLELIAERKVEDPAVTASTALAGDEDLLSENEAVPPRLEEAQKQWSQLGESLADLRASLLIDQQMAGRLPEIEAAERYLAEAVPDLEAANALSKTLGEEGNQVGAQQEELSREMEQTGSDLRWLNEKIDGLQPFVVRAEQLAMADETIQRLSEEAAVITGDRDAVADTLTLVNNETAGLTRLIEAADSRVQSLRDQVTANQQSVDGLQARIEPFLAMANKSSFLKDALATEEVLLHQLSGLDADLEDLEHQRDKVAQQVDGTTRPESVDISGYETAVSDARAVDTDLRTRLAVSRQQLATAEQKAIRYGELSAQVKLLEQTTDRWNLIGRTLGRDGLQAEDVAAAGDEINELANELLHASGAEYTVDVKTTRPTKDGKKEVEGCPIFVYNSKTREWQEGGTLSPGQRAFVNLPLSLALAMIGCADSSVRPTLFQDEPTSGLDPERRPQYVAMMRYAVRKVKASKIFFITHNEELMEMADSRIIIDKGSLTVS